MFMVWITSLISSRVPVILIFRNETILVMFLGHHPKMFSRHWSHRKWDMAVQVSHVQWELLWVGQFGGPDRNKAITNFIQVVPWGDDDICAQVVNFWKLDYGLAFSRDCLEISVDDKCVNCGMFLTILKVVIMLCRFPLRIAIHVCQTTGPLLQSVWIVLVSD